MTMLFYAALALVVAAILGSLFVRLDATRLATSLRLAGPALAGILGVGLLLTGRVGMGTMVLSGALAWYASGRSRRRVQKSPGKRSTVRTAAIEMELDHDSGRLEGIVLAGRFEGRRLDQLDLADLLDLAAGLTADEDSLRLLETYLDSRFPVWRDHVEAQRDDRQSGPAAAGGMTKEEAYQILGLEPGAGAADVRKAHRRLMQRLHPDVGGSSFLAARINQAKDVLLSKHG